MISKILLVEDDKSISEMVEHYLTKEGFDITTAFDGEQGINTFLNNNYDLILLDLMLPKLDGMEFIKIVREKNLVPILIMSAKDTDVDKALGLGFGADDYISKPFSMIELSARIKALIRRATKYSTDSNRVQNNVTIGNLTIDFDNFSVIKNGTIINLTCKEFNILKLFITNQNRVYTKAQIYSIIWEDNYYGDDNVINVHIRRLREKIEDNPSNPKFIKTIWGIGYKLGEF